MEASDSMSYLPVARDGHDAAEVYTRILHFGDNKIHGLQPHFNRRRDFALVGDVHAADHVQQCRLARAGSADDGGEFALLTFF